MGRIRLTATTESVAEVARRVSELVDETGLGPERAYRLRLAAEEIATNVVVHGYGEAPGGLEIGGPAGFDMSWGSDDERVWVQLEDNARPFDPTTEPAPGDLDAPLTERREGGLGIHLVRDAIDEFRYRRVGDTNQVLLAVRRR